MNELTCPKCGMLERDWTDPGGYAKDGEIYCCEGCAEGSGCTCHQSGAEPDEELPTQE